jgi:pilus assembly protein CpaC
MKTVNPERRRTLQNAGARLVAVVGLASLVATAALAVETPTPMRRELVPTGARATIYLDVADTAEDTVRALHMERGKSAFVRTSYGVRRVSVGDPKVADVVVLRQSELQIVAKKVGTTNVVIWSTSGEIEAAIDLHVGRAYSSIESEINRVLGTRDVQIESAGDAIVLTGSVPDAAALERVVSVAHAYFPEKDKAQIVNLVSVGGNQQVMIEITVSEMSRDLRKAIGTNLAAQIVKDGDTFFEFNTLIDSLTRPTLDGGTEIIEFSDSINFLGSAFPIGTGAYQLFVNALDETGLGKILAEPTLVARTGETANFLAGGEIPIPVAQGGAFGSITVEYKEFGVGVAFTPTVLGDDRIHLDVATEVSQIDFGLGTAVAGFTTPGFRTRRASTGVELGDGQVFAIAGLLRDELTEKVSQYPVLGQIPILGMLFRSSEYQNRLTELVLLVRPRLIQPLGPESPPLPTDYFDQPNWFEFYFLGRTEGFDDQYAAAPREEDLPEAGLVGDAGYRLPASHDDEENE